VNITLECARVDLLQHYQLSQAGLSFNVFSLNTHENKLSVLHFKIQRTENYLDPIKSKEELIFQVCNILDFILNLLLMNIFSLKIRLVLEVLKQSRYLVNRI
jgi:hypothetical protein